MVSSREIGGNDDSHLNQMFGEDSMMNYDPYDLGDVPGGSYAPQPRRYDSEFLKLYDVEDILITIENFLRGRNKDENGDLVQVYQPLVDKEGINLLMGDLRFHLHKIVFLSNLSKDDVRRMALEMRKMIIRWIYLNWHSHNIDKGNMDRIVYNVDHAIFCALMKPLNDKERTHLGETTTRSEHINVNEEKKSRKFGFI